MEGRDAESDDHEGDREAWPAEVAATVAHGTPLNEYVMRRARSYFPIAHLSKAEMLRCDGVTTAQPARPGRGPAHPACPTSRTWTAPPRGALARRRDRPRPGAARPATRRSWRRRCARRRRPGSTGRVRGAGRHRADPR